MTRALACLAMGLLLPLAAIAAEPPPLTSAAAKWVEEGHVELTVSWEGGACEAPGEAAVEATEADELTDSVTIPTTSTAEVCTMQIVQLEFTGIIPVEPLTEKLAVMVLGPDGQPRAAGSVTIEKTAG
jgi:hypothetical protein